VSEIRRLDALPEPKFNMGQTVYFATTEQESKQHSCPDCFDIKKWKVTSPAGEIFETNCPRCNNQYASRDIPSLTYYVTVPKIAKLTVGKIEATTFLQWEGDRNFVRYMCNETGVGSGSIYEEDKLFATFEEAKTRADEMAREKTETEAATPSAMVGKYLSDLKINNAILDDAWRARWNAWYKYRSLKEIIEEAIEQKTMSLQELLESLNDQIQYNNTSIDRQSVEGNLLTIQKFFADGSATREEVLEALKELRAPEPEEKKAEIDF